MRQVTRKGLMTVMAATGVIAAAGGYAHADSAANGSASHSPGVASGNTVQAPVHVPVNVCGNTVDVVGILNPAAGNSCTNQSGGGDSAGGSGANSGSGGAQADGHSSHSPGVASGNHVQAPVHVPVNVCGNSVDVVGALNPAVGNSCTNQGGNGGDSAGGGSGTGGSGANSGSGGAQADGHSSHSPGVASGNHVQAPVHVPVNVCGNTVDVVGILNPAAGNSCTNQGGNGGDSAGGGSSTGGSGANSGSGGAQADGHSSHSPGVASGNTVQAPVHVPVNVCGNSVDVVGILNPAVGNSCTNDSGPGQNHGTPPGGEQENPGDPGNQGPGNPGNPGDQGPGDQGPSNPGDPGNQGPGDQGPDRPGDSGPSGPEGAPSTPERMTPAGASTDHRPAGSSSSAQLANTGSELPLGLTLPVGAGALLAGAVLYRKARASM
ncbi:chaplin [Streptomyces sp. A012304]|uniref:chaplin n=1 Tax=Streptomyces sp. A012304 TaxID=375446 RepID=UPI002801BF8E|nr:chaplin family protein [Streptomyces sp. A012304]GKQ39676.1 hypothetical protein ALMP_62030 [Streptomyces sp. A012304]